jgi:hypothetical protein
MSADIRALVRSSAGSPGKVVTVDDDAKQEMLNLLRQWRDEDEPLVEAIGDTLARWHRVDSQDRARRVVDTVIEVLDREL